MKRRHFLGMAAALPAFSAVPIDVKSIKSRGERKVDIAYKSPHTNPNGLQATSEGLWVLDDHTTDGNNFVSLVNFADGKLVREVSVPGLNTPSGMSVDAEGNLWINSTHAGLIFRCNSKDGSVQAKYTSPGVGLGFRVKGDPPATRSPLTPAYPPMIAANNAGAGRGASGRSGAGGRSGGGGRASLGPGQVALTATAAGAGEGGQGMEFRDGLLYTAVLPTRRVYVIDPARWEVQAMWQLAGNRAHGVGWEGDSLWVSDTNWRAFFRHDIRTGEIVEKIQLTEKDPLIHGATVHDGYMWYCDDVGYICNFKL